MRTGRPLAELVLEAEDSLQFQAFQIDLGDSAGFIALAIYVENVVVVGEIFLGQT